MVLYTASKHIHNKTILTQIQSHTHTLLIQHKWYEVILQVLTFNLLTRRTYGWRSSAVF